MAKINQNTLAKKICSLEGGEINLSVAQVKEVIRHTLDELSQADLLDVVRLLQRRRTVS